MKNNFILGFIGGIAGSIFLSLGFEQIYIIWAVVTFIYLYINDPNLKYNFHKYWVAGFIASWLWPFFWGYVVISSLKDKIKFQSPIKFRDSE